MTSEFDNFSGFDDPGQSFDNSSGPSGGIADITGTFSVTVPAPALAFSGALSFVGTFSVVVPAPTPAFAGDVAAPVNPVPAPAAGSAGPKPLYLPYVRPEPASPRLPEPIREVSGSFALSVPAPRLSFVGSYSAPARREPPPPPAPISGRLSLRSFPRPRVAFVGVVDNTEPERRRREEDEILAIVLAIDADRRLEPALN